MIEGKTITDHIFYHADIPHHDTEKIDYFALDKRVARHEAVKRYPLMALKHDSKPPVPLLPILSESTEAIWSSPLAAFAVQAMQGNDTEDDAVASLLDPFGPWYLDTTLQVPDCSSRIRFTTKHAKTNMSLSHWLKLIIRVERGDDVAVDAKGRRKQVSIGGQWLWNLLSDNMGHRPI